MARTLAAEGLPVVRFDYHGVGDSDGIAEAFDLRRPFVSDLTPVVRRLTADDDHPVVPVGICFGARTAMAFAASCPQSIAGLVLVSCPLSVRRGSVAEKLAGRLTYGEMLRRAVRFDPRQLSDPTVRRAVTKGLRAVWRARIMGRGPVAESMRSSPHVDPEVVEAIAALPPSADVLFVYGPDEVDPTVDQLQSQPDAVLPAAATRRVAVCSVPIQGFARAAAYDEVLAHVVDLVRGLRGSDGRGVSDGRSA
jgi:pimeloyl-ACP methyl ester carboxylesterase